MHKFAERIAECVKAKVDEIGIQKFEGQMLDDLKDWTEIMKNLVCYDKDYKIVEAMEKAKDDEIVDHAEYYDDDFRRYYRGQPRDARGRYTYGRRGRRRGYEEYMPDDMMDDMYMYPFNRMRDMDMDMGRMYYSGNGGNQGGNLNGGRGNMNGSGGNMNGSGGGMRDSREGRSGRSRRNYMETKEMHSNNTPQDKQMKLQELENYMRELGDDMTEMIQNSSSEERQTLKTRLIELSNRI